MNSLLSTTILGSKPGDQVCVGFKPILLTRGHVVSSICHLDVLFTLIINKSINMGPLWAHTTIFVLDLLIDVTRYTVHSSTCLDNQILNAHFNVGHSTIDFMSDSMFNEMI